MTFSTHYQQVRGGRAIRAQARSRRHHWREMTRLASFARSGHPHRGKSDRKGRSFSNLAVHRDGSPLALDNFRDNVESHA